MGENIIEDLAFLEYWFGESEDCFILPYIETNFHESSWNYQYWFMKKNLYFSKAIIDDYTQDTQEKLFDLIDNLRFGKSKIVMVVGARGSGKTATALYLAEEARNKGNHKTVYYVGEPENRKIYPAYFKFVKSLDELHPGSFAVIDEAAIKYNARNFKNKDNVELTEKLVILRHQDITLVLITQNISLIEINADRLADIVIYKIGSDYGIRKKRQMNLSDFDKQNMLIVNRLKPRVKEDCLIEYRSGAKNIYRTIVTPLPSFWEEKVSKSFRNYKIESKQDEDKKDRRIIQI